MIENTTAKQTDEESEFSYKMDIDNLFSPSLIAIKAYAEVLPIAIDKLEEDEDSCNRDNFNEVSDLVFALRKGIIDNVNQIYHVLGILVGSHRIVPLEEKYKPTQIPYACKSCEKEYDPENFALLEDCYGNHHCSHCGSKRVQTSYP